MEVKMVPYRNLQQIWSNFFILKTKSRDYKKQKHRFSFNLISFLTYHFIFLFYLWFHNFLGASCGVAGSICSNFVPSLFVIGSPLPVHWDYFCVSYEWLSRCQNWTFSLLSLFRLTWSSIIHSFPTFFSKILKMLHFSVYFLNLLCLLLFLFWY